LAKCMLHGLLKRRAKRTASLKCNKNPLSKRLFAILRCICFVIN